MRFLIGLICGAGLIFAVVGMLGNASAELSGRLPAWLDDVAVQAGEWLSLPPGHPRTMPERGGRPPASDPAGPQAGGDEAAADLPAASMPIPRPPDPRTVDEVVAGVEPPAPSGSRDEDVQTLVAEIFGPRDSAAAPEPQPSSAPPGSPETAAPRRGAEEPSVDPVDGTASQTVWVPFHSQMSAAGFASRLSESLGHPFDVERQGPGRYQVVFAYADETERAALLEEAAALTGLPL